MRAYVVPRALVGNHSQINLGHCLGILNINYLNLKLENVKDFTNREVKNFFQIDELDKCFESILNL